MFELTAAEKLVQVQAELAEQEAAERVAFYAEEEEWAHEFDDPNQA